MATNSKEKLPACKLSTIINRQFMTVRLIGKGSYGVVYEAVRLNSPDSRFAIKAELAATHNNLKTEWELMRLLKESGAKHNVNGVELGCERNFNYLVMGLVGPSLSDLRKASPNMRFTLYTTVVCGIQCFDSLEEIQKLGYIHRDVKPSNFAIGMLGSEKEKLIHVLDFGICRNLFNKKKVLRKPRMKAPFRGTVIYCSLNIHLRMEPGRHDDFWSLLYMLMEFHLGSLPWEKMTKENTKNAKEKQIEGLLEKCPVEFKMIRCLLATLKYSNVPDYEKLRGILCQIMLSTKMVPDKPLDWQPGGAYESTFKSWKKNSSDSTKISLPELINLPKAGTIQFSLKDFPDPGEQEPIRDTSVSASDDTIIEKEGPPPAPKHVSRPVVPVRGSTRGSAEQPTPGVGKKSRKEPSPYSREQVNSKADQATPGTNNNMILTPEMIKLYVRGFKKPVGSKRGKSSEQASKGAAKKSDPKVEI